MSSWNQPVGTGLCPASLADQATERAIGPSPQQSPSQNEVTAFSLRLVAKAKAAEGCRTPRRFATSLSWLLLTLLGLLFASALARAQGTYEAYSPVVSYVFEDSLASADAYSPAVSYVFMEALPDDVTSEFSSAPVSYFYNIAPPGLPALVSLAGRVLDEAGQGVTGARVQVLEAGREVAAVNTLAGDDWFFAALPPGVYELSATAPERVTDRRVFTLTPLTGWQVLQLPARPSAPVLERLPNADEVAKIPLPRLDAEGSRLLRFSGGGWVPVVNAGELLGDRMTVAFTHGWKSNPNEWASSMAAALVARELDDDLNLVAWDWTEAARGPLPPEEKTPRQGLFLGQALRNALGASYTGRIHLLGHSLGTLVNSAAANFLHGDRTERQEVASPAWAAGQTHVTLFDEASIARVIGKEVLSEALEGTLDHGAKAGLLLAGLEALKGWKTPMPVRAGWADNYISAVGFYRSRALNVCLSKAIPLTASLQDAHSYPQRWYEDTIRTPGDLPAGFRRSWEANLVDALPRITFPPLETELVRGDAYDQAPASGDPLVLAKLPAGRIYECLFPALGVTAAITLQETVSAVAQGARATADVVLEVVDWAGDQAQRGVNYVAGRVEAGGEAIVDFGRRTTLRIVMRTRQLVGGGSRQRASPGLVQGEETGIWLTLLVPDGAALLLFDFKVEGDGREDTLVFALNGTNQFSLETKFIPVGEPQTSRAIEVSGLAGRTNEFFFGIVGGTSTNCVVTVENLRFLTLQPPQLAVESAGTDVLLSWPSTANGYVVESAVTLTPLKWQTGTNPPALFGGRFWLTNAVTEEGRFFRLRQE